MWHLHLALDQEDAGMNENIAPQGPTKLMDVTVKENRIRDWHFKVVQAVVAPGIHSEGVTAVQPSIMVVLGEEWQRSKERDGNVK